MGNSIQPFRPSICENGFSLVEVVIAMGVTSFCIVILLGLLPLGLTTAQDGRRETRALYLADQLVSDLRASSFTNAAVLSRNGGGTLEALPAFSLAVSATNFVTCDGQGNVLAQVTPGQYASGVNDAGANYLIQITVTPTALNKLSSVFVEVGAPAQAALSARSRFGFQTMIGNRQ